MVSIALLGLVGGLITGVSPCVLPMLPIIFFAGGANDPAALEHQSTEQPRRRWYQLERRPLLIIAGLVTSFSVFTLVGTAIIAALGLPQDVLRWTGLTVLTLVALGFLYEPLGHLLERPFYRLPKISHNSGRGFVLGLGLGTLYVPCAGPVLAAITVASATGQIDVRTIVLTVSFAAGAALPLLVFVQAGSKIRARINAYRQRAQGFRIAGGVLLLALAVGLAFDLPATLQRAVPAYTSGVEHRLADSKTLQGALDPYATAENRELAHCTPGDDALASCGPAPTLRDNQQWFNSQPLTLAELHGKVVMLDFWAYSCINCQRDEPHLSAWYERYRSLGFAVVGIHSPEFAFEKNAANVSAAIRRENIAYPVVQDNNLSTWRAYRNRYWPANYLIDPTGTVRAIRFGEGGYAQTEHLLRALLRAANPGVALPPAVDDKSTDSADLMAGRTPELYLSAYRNQGYDGRPRIGRTITDYQLNAHQARNTFSLGGSWHPGQQFLEAGHAATLRLHYRARDVFHVIAGSGTVTVSEAGRRDRLVEVHGSPNAYPIVADDPDGDGTVTLRYSEGLRIYTFAFG